MKPARWIFSFFVLLIVCHSVFAGQEFIDLAEAQRRFQKARWKAVEPVGIPSRMKGYKIRRYPGQTRVDLVSKSNVYVIYEEFVVSESGDPPLPPKNGETGEVSPKFTRVNRQQILVDAFDQKGSLGELLGVDLPVFQYYDVVDLGTDSYIDLIGFAGERMFKIHAWRNPEADQSERVVALDVAQCVLEVFAGR